MTFQVKKIVLYGLGEDSQDPQIVEFKENTVNIITGPTLSGKSTLLEIMQYCLGGKDCMIPSGVTRDSVSWVGIELLLSTGESLLIVRSLPRNNSQTDKIYYESGNELAIPKRNSLNGNINYAELIRRLETTLGLDPKTVIDKSGARYSSKLQLLDEALVYCFQSQNEIANSDFLFHITEKKSTQHIRDYLPFFLGAVSADYTDKKQYLSKLLKRRDELQHIGQQKIISVSTSRFIDEAREIFTSGKNVGLIQSTEVLHPTLNGIKQQFSDVIKIDPTDANLSIPDQQDDIERMDRILHLTEEKNRYEKMVKALKHHHMAMSDYEKGVAEQRLRLKSINLISDMETETICPLCSSHLVSPPPSVSQIKKQLKSVENELDQIKTNIPALDRIRIRCEEKLRNTKSELAKLQSEHRKHLGENKHLERLRDKTNLQFEIIGMIRSFLNRVSDFEEENVDTQEELADIITQINEMENDHVFMENTKSLNRVLESINGKLTEYANEIHLFGTEYKDYSLSFDLDKLTVKITTEAGEFKLEETGGGTRWVAIHVILHLVLHEYFVTNNCSIPHFLFLDQPSQANASYAHFPDDSERSTRRIPTPEYKALIELITRVTMKIPNFQVIITEQVWYGHDESWYDNYVCENWWTKKKRLIPIEWLPPEQRELSAYGIS